MATINKRSNRDYVRHLETIEKLLEEGGGGGGTPNAVKYTPQSLSSTQQEQARTNIGSASASALSQKQDTLVSGTNIKTLNNQSLLGSGNITIDDQSAVKYTEAQSLSNAQKATARGNIAAASLSDINNPQYVKAAIRPEPSENTVGPIYLIGPDANDEYERYFTQESNGTYTWVALGSTEIHMDGYATDQDIEDVNDEISHLEAKVDDISTGKYYGYYATAADLPDDATVDGFAYVGSGPTYTIYNCEGGVWTSSGITVNQSPIGNDEDIDQNEDGKLQFANRVYNSLQPNGMGHKIIRKDSTFASQVTNTKTIYEIRYDFNLGGSVLSIPADTILEFKGGSLTNVGGLNLGKNVTINGNGTTIQLSGSIRMNLYCKIFGTTIQRTTQLADNEAIVLFDDSYFDRIESNVGCILRDCKISYKVGDGANTHGYAVELVSDGQFVYSGYFGVTFDNVLVDSYCNIGFYIHNEKSVVGGTTYNGWITDIIFNRCFVEMAKVGWMLESNSSHSVQEINLVDCSMQSTSWCTYGMDIGFADRIHVVACEFWDWNNVPHNPLNVHDNTGDIYIDTLTPARESIGYDLNGTYPNKQGRNAIHIEHLYKQSKNLKVVIDLTTSDIKLADWYNIPNGSYVIDQDGTLDAKLGLTLGRGGTLFVYGDGNENYFFKGYIFIGNRAQADLELRDIAFMTLYAKPNNTDILDASVWFKPTTMTQVPTYANNYAMKLKGSARYFHSKPYELARGSSLPSAGTAMAGDVYINSSNSMAAYCDGYEWFYIMTRKVSMVGSTRPTPRGFETGMYFFDTGITPHRPIWWTGSVWVDSDGFPAVNRKGTTATRTGLTLTSNEAGFTFFDTDLGKMVLWNGTAWVNMDGTALS